MYSYIELLRAIAALLITNSHFDGVYPWNISWGGCPGVALFFVISGFLLTKSVQKQKFFPWWIKKVVRLYISLTLVNVITVLIGFRKPSLMLFVFPITVNLWYVPAMTILYILYYIVLKWIDKKYRWTICGICMVGYAILYRIRFRNDFFVEPEIPFRMIYGFIAMMLGSIIYDAKENVDLINRRLAWLVLSFTSCAGFLGMKLFMNRISILLDIQFMTQVFGVAFAIFSLLAAIGYSHECAKIMKTGVGKVLSIVSKCSLELYLVQFAIIAYFKNLTFPVNFIMIIVIMLISASIVLFIANAIMKKSNLFSICN